MHPGRNFNKEKVKHNETTSINDSPPITFDPVHLNHESHTALHVFYRGTHI